MTNDECEKCKNKYCTKECFNMHVGSTIALQKLLDEMGVKGDIIDAKRIYRLN